MAYERINWKNSNTQLTPENLDIMDEGIDNKPGEKIEGQGEIFNSYVTSGDTIRNEATGVGSHAEGNGTKATNTNSHAEGIRTTASGPYSHSEGNSTQAIGQSSHTEGQNTHATAPYAHAEGQDSKAIGQGSHSEGIGCNSVGNNSHAEGRYTYAYGVNSHTEGEGAWTGNTTGGGNNAHAEGYLTRAYGQNSHAEGESTETRSGAANSHAEGTSCQARKTASHAEGYETIAGGLYSHSQGYKTEAVGDYSSASGYRTIANDYQTVIGKFNEDIDGPEGISDTTSGALFIVGNGNSSTTTSNAFRVDTDGVIHYTTGVSQGADYAEMWEWFDSNLDKEDRRGKFVTSVGNKIRFANSSDDYILGVTSGFPVIIGDAPEQWHDKYILDVFGAPVIEEVTPDPRPWLLKGHPLSASACCFDDEIVKTGTTEDDTISTFTQTTRTSVTTITPKEPFNANAFYIQLINEGTTSLNVKDIKINGSIDYVDKVYWSQLEGNNVVYTKVAGVVDSVLSPIEPGTQDSIAPKDGMLTVILKENIDVQNIKITLNTDEKFPLVKIMYRSYYDDSIKLLNEDPTGVIYSEEPYLTRKLNPNYDPNKEYIPREKRPEWSAVGTHGKLVIEDDGTCEVDGYCWASENGIGTADTKNKVYRVIERIDETHVRIVLK